MPMSTMLQYNNKDIPYSTFVSDVAAKIVYLLKQESADPEYISQRKAFAMFGRANVERWRNKGKIIPHKRPGKIEYKTSELRLQQRTQQDYF